MDDKQKEHGLARLLADTARAHHEATGGVNADWARWYAERMTGDIDEFVGYSPPVETVEQWLIAADEQYRAEEREERWPPYYARLFIEEYADG